MDWTPKSTIVGEQLGLREEPPCWSRLVVRAHRNRKAQSGQIYSEARDVSSDNMLGGFQRSSSTHKVVHRSFGRGPCGPPTFRDPKRSVKSECMTTFPRSNSRRHLLVTCSHELVKVLAPDNVAEMGVYLKNVRFSLLISL